MKAYTGTFKKKDGSLRTMTFAKMKDLPQQFLAETLKGGRSSKQIEGSENAYVAADDIEFGFGNKIPLWLFGFLY